eukprot:13500065-Alexandrium_andersonii.AAC.1
MQPSSVLEERVRRADDSCIGLVRKKAVDEEGNTVACESSATAQRRTWCSGRRPSGWRYCR